MDSIRTMDSFGYREKEQTEVRTHSMPSKSAVMIISILLVLLMFCLQILYMRSEMTVINDEYSVLSAHTGDLTPTASVLSLENNKTERINIEVPDYCPVNYASRAPIAMVYDKTTGEVLYSKNETEKCSPASLVKLMTASVAIDLTADEFVFTAGQELDLVEEYASFTGLKKCNKLDRTQMMDALVMNGGSDAAYTASASIGRLLSEDSDISSLEAVGIFVDRMNAAATALGCSSTHFTNPDGYADDNMYTTCMDMMKIAVYATDHSDITASASKAHSGGKLVSGQSYEWLNSNKLLLENSNEYYPYATGLKTGMSGDSGYCTVSTAKRYGHELICVVMGADSSADRNFDVTSLFDISFGYIEEFSQSAEETEII